MSGCVLAVLGLTGPHGALLAVLGLTDSEPTQSVEWCMASSSTFQANGCKSAGSSLVWGLHFRALVCSVCFKVGVGGAGGGGVGGGGVSPCTPVALPPRSVNGFSQ